MLGELPRIFDRKLLFTNTTIELAIVPRSSHILFYIEERPREALRGWRLAPTLRVPPLRTAIIAILMLVVNVLLRFEFIVARPIAITSYASAHTDTYTRTFTRTHV